MGKYYFRRISKLQLCNVVGCCILAALSVSLINSCENKEKEPQLVINEVMASNHCGLMASDSTLYDWLEIKNTSNDPVSLAGYTLVVEDDAQKKKEKGKKVKKKSWELPDRQVKPGECIIIFASKKDTSEVDNGELHANFKLSDLGGTIKLMKGEDVVSQMTYGQLENDQCCRLMSDTTYEVSYQATPGFDNTPEGFEQYNTLIEKQRPSPLKLWEMHSKGQKDGAAWIEVKNVSDSAINLHDYYLSTHKKNMSEWQLPEKQLKPGTVMVLKIKRDEFKISPTKSVMLTKNGKFVDGINANDAPYGVTVGRAEGKDGFFYFPTPTKDAENATEHYRFMAPPPTFISKPGVYSDKKKMLVKLDTHGLTTHYTTDGSLPTSESPVYEDSIVVDTTAIIRAYCEGDSITMRSKTSTGSFIYAEQHTIPVFNITVDKADLYDHRSGIYADGPGGGGEFPHKGANYWKHWWKKAHIEFFDKEKGFSQDCELAIFGGFSRALAKKSFKIRFKNTDGPSHITYDLFNTGKPQEYKNFVLRSGSQDITGVMVRDEFFTSLMKPQSPTLIIQNYRPVALYINGEYFGLYYIREKIDKNFAAQRLNTSNDSINIMMSALYCEEGNLKSYKEFISYVKSHDLEEAEHYNYVKEHFDLTSLIDYKLGEIYSGNTDVGNVRYLQSLDKNSDKKWYVVFYDLDATWVVNKSAAYHLLPGGTSVERAVNLLISKLLKNNEFRALFLERLSLHMHKTFSAKNATTVFDNLINTIKPEMVRNCERWSNLMSYSKWESNVKEFREKFQDRDKDMLNDLREVLKITDEENAKYFADLGF